MKTLLSTTLLAVALFSSARATSTINATNNSAWGANIGWTNWLPSAADGVVIGEFVCSGYVYGANIGWINMGSGTPTNHIQYLQGAGDTGVNYMIDPMQPGVATLRGYAYGANIGWINFESNGNPRLSLFTGTFSGYAYSANCGWINLNDVLGKVQTDHVAMGVDTDMDGIADAFEYQYFGNLTTANGTSDNDHDGMTDLQEYLDGTNPMVPNTALRVTALSANPGGTSSVLTFTSTAARLYQIETTTDLLSMWMLDTNFGTFAPDAMPGTSTSKMLTETTSSKRFFRVRAIRPLP
jgi:hypothetical protein